MAISLIPPLNTRGIYTLRDPWVSDVTRIYACIGVERFSALAARNINVYETYYKARGLAQTVYDEDNAAGAAIITLANEFAEPISVPSTYIVSYPNLGSVTYDHIVLSVSLGELYSGIGLEGVQEQIALAVEGVIGVTPAVKVHTAPSKNAITPDQHQTIEANRNAAITNRTTNAATIIALQRQVAELQQQNAAMTQILIDNHWVGNA